MKKLLATLLSMLLLCSMIPFAAVSAAGDYYIELVADAEEVDAGDEITVEVSLYGHESVGLIAALIELGYDHDVFEPVTYYDEDEEMWMHAIEIGPKFSASSNKYISFGPIDEETGAASNCSVYFKRATATATQAVKTNLFYTATFKVKDDAPSGTYTIDVIKYNDKNLVMHGNAYDVWTWEPITVTVNGTEPPHTHNYTGTETKAATCGEDGVMTYACECGEGTYTEAIPATGKHTYDGVYDVNCNVCGDVRVVDFTVITANGTSMNETNDGLTGLAFKFCLSDKMIGLALREGTKYVADYTNTMVAPDPTGFHKLVKMGAVVANNGSVTILDNVDGKYVKDVPAEKIVLEGEDAPYYAVRIINIPASQNDAIITCTPYYIYEDANGEQIVVYGEEQAASVNSVLQKSAH